MDARKWIVESAYFEHMTGMRYAFLTIDIILEQLIHDEEGIMCVVK